MNVHSKPSSGGGEARIEALLDAERDRDEPPAGFPAIPEIPGCRYIEESFLALERAHVFKAMWLCAGDTHDLREPGDFRVFTRSGAPILIIRGKDGDLRAFYNVCRHRGAPVVREDAGNAKLLRCQYHSWSYGLDGRLIGVPDERDFICLDKSARGLIELPCHEWAGLVFVSENADAGPFRDQYGAMLDELAWLETGDLRLVHRQSYAMDCNWKAAMDAFLEIYHVNTIHPGSGAIVFDPRAFWPNWCATGTAG